MIPSEFKTAILLFYVTGALSLATRAQSSQTRSGSSPAQSSATAQKQDTASNKSKKVRNRDLPYNSDAELYNAGSPANVMHERSGTLNPGKDFHTQGSTGPKKDTVNLQGREPQ